jgi:hypothetical protein
MVKITFIERAPFDTKQLMLNVLGGSKVGMTLRDMRRRLALMDKIDAATGEIDLHREDHELIRDILETSPIFGVADKRLVEVADSIVAPEKFS